MGDWDAVSTAVASKSTPPPASGTEWDAVEQKQPEQAGGFSRFFSSVASALDPRPAIKEFLDRPQQNRDAGDALTVLDRIHARAAALPENHGKPISQWKSPELTPDEQGIVERGMHANLGSPEGQHPMLAPAMQAASQAMGGDYAGAAGSLVGGYAVPAAIGAAAEAAPGALRAGASRVAEAVKKPGTGKIVIGAGQAAGGAGLAMGGHPILGGAEVARGVSNFREGMAARRAAQTRTMPTATRAVGAPASMPVEEMRTPQAPEPMPEVSQEHPVITRMREAANARQPQAPNVPQGDYRSPGSLDQGAAAYAGTPPIEAPSRGNVIPIRVSPASAPAAPVQSAEPVISAPPPELPTSGATPVQAKAPRARAAKAAAPAEAPTTQITPSSEEPKGEVAAGTNWNVERQTPLNPKAQGIADQLSAEMAKNDQAPSDYASRIPPEQTKLESKAYEMLRRKVKAGAMADLLQKHGVTPEQASMMHDGHWQDLTRATGTVEGESVHPPSAETKAYVIDQLSKRAKAAGIAGQLQQEMTR